MMNKKILINLKKIKWIFLDVDGVLTDGGMYYSIHGDVMKKFNINCDIIEPKLVEKNSRHLVACHWN